MISIREAERALKSAGAKKVSSDAKDELVLTVKELVKDIAERAVAQCNHRRMVILSREDVRMATR